MRPVCGLKMGEPVSKDDLASLRRQRNEFARAVDASFVHEGGEIHSELRGTRTLWRCVHCNAKEKQANQHYGYDHERGCVVLAAQACVALQQSGDTDADTSG